MSPILRAAPARPITAAVNTVSRDAVRLRLRLARRRLPSGCPVACCAAGGACWGVAMDNRVDVPGYKPYRLRADGSRPAVFVAFLDIVRRSRRRRDRRLRAGRRRASCAALDRPRAQLRAHRRDRRRRRARRGTRLGLRRLGRPAAARLREGVARGHAPSSAATTSTACCAAFAALGPDERAPLRGSPPRVGEPGPVCGSRADRDGADAGALSARRSPRRSSIARCRWTGRRRTGTARA